MSDTVKRYSKRKGFESIPRELLQSKELSLEAIGLLCNLQSYPSTWVLHKTELRKRFKNKEKVVDRIWDELVAYGYILQFRKRKGRKYVYEYFFNVEKFNLDEIQDLCAMMHDQGMKLYHKEMIRIKKGESIDYKKYIVLADDDKKKLDLSFWDSQNGNLKKDDETGITSGSQNGNPNLEIPKQEGNRLTNNRFTTKTSEGSYAPSDTDEEDNKLKDESQSDENEMLLKLNQIITTNFELKELALILRAADVGLESIYNILAYFHANPDIFDKRLIKQQFDWMSLKVDKDGGIGDYSKYFINGYAKRLESRNGSKIDGLDELLGIKNDPPKISMHDWLNES